MQAQAGKGPQPHFVNGKCHSGSDPYSVITTAFGDFAKELKASQNPTSEEIAKEAWFRGKIKDNLGKDAIALGNIIPDLKPFLGTSLTDYMEQSNNARVVDVNSWNRVRYIFQSFVNAISTAEHPLVLFLDDLQWVDGASLKLIYSLLMDQELKNFMFIGAYRSDEVHSGDVLWKTLEQVQMVQDLSLIHI